MASNQKREAVDVNIINELTEKMKTKGLFDHLRRICLAQIDSAPGYKNLTYRVESQVNRFLSKERWHPRMSKQMLRERLRSSLDQTAILQKGIQFMVDRLIETKLYDIIKPKIISSFCDILQLSEAESYRLAQKLTGQFVEEQPEDAISEELLSEFDVKPSIDAQFETTASFMPGGGSRLSTFVDDPGNRLQPPLFGPRPSFGKRFPGPPPHVRFDPNVPPPRFDTPPPPISQRFPRPQFQPTGFPPEVANRPTNVMPPHTDTSVDSIDQDEQESITVEMEDAGTSEERNEDEETAPPPSQSTPVISNMQQSFQELANEFSTFAQQPDTSAKNPLEMYSKLERVFQQLVTTAGPGSTGALLKQYFTHMASPEKQRQQWDHYQEPKKRHHVPTKGMEDESEPPSDRPIGVSVAFDSLRKQVATSSPEKAKTESTLDYDDLSDITVSSVHTSDLSNFELSDTGGKSSQEKTDKVIKAKRLKSKAKRDSRRQKKGDETKESKKSASPRPIVVSKKPVERKRTPMSSDEDWDAERRVFDRFANRKGRKRFRSRSPIAKSRSPLTRQSRSPSQKSRSRSPFRARKRRGRPPKKRLPTELSPPAAKRKRPPQTPPPARPSTPPEPEKPQVSHSPAPPTDAERKQPYSPLSSDDEETLSKIKESVQRELATIKVERKPRATSTGRAPSRLVLETSEGVPPGWTKRVMERQSGTSAGSLDVYIFDPSEKKFRSRPEVESHLKMIHSDYTVAGFDFSKPSRAVLRETAVRDIGESSSSRSRGHRRHRRSSHRHRHRSKRSTSREKTKLEGVVDPPLPSVESASAEEKLPPPSQQPPSPPQSTEPEGEQTDIVNTGSDDHSPVAKGFKSTFRLIDA